MSPTPSPGRRPHAAHRHPFARRWRLVVLVACVSLPLLAFGVTGALWLHERHWLGWVGLAFLCGESLLLWWLRRWGRADAVLPQPPGVLPPTFAPRDEAAWALVQDYLKRIDDGEIVFEEIEQFLSLG